MSKSTQKKIGAFAVVAAVAVAVVASMLGAQGGEKATTSADADETPTVAPGSSLEVQPGVAVIDQAFVDSINKCERLLVTREEVESSLGFRAEDPALWKPAGHKKYDGRGAATVESWGGVVLGCEYASPQRGSDEPVVIGGYLVREQGSDQVVISAYSADAPPPLDRSKPVQGIGDEAEFSPTGNGDGHVFGAEGASSILQVRSGDLILRFNGGLHDIPGGVGFGIPRLRQLAGDALATLGEHAPANGVDDEDSATKATLSPEERIEQTGNKWAPLFAAARDRAACQYQGQPLCERIACERLGGFKVRNCTPPSSAFRKSFEGATVQDIAIKGDQAEARFSNGEVVELEGDADPSPLAGVWYIHKLVGNAGRGFFE